MGIGVVATVGVEPLWPASGPTHLPYDSRHSIDERDQLRNIVAVSARERDGERQAVAVDDQVVLGAPPAAVNRARARLGAPFFA